MVPWPRGGGGGHSEVRERHGDIVGDTRNWDIKEWGHRERHGDTGAGDRDMGATLQGTGGTPRGHGDIGGTLRGTGGTWGHRGVHGEEVTLRSEVASGGDPRRCHQSQDGEVTALSHPPRQVQVLQNVLGYLEFLQERVRAARAAAGDPRPLPKI